MRQAVSPRRKETEKTISPDNPAKLNKAESTDECASPLIPRSSQPSIDEDEAPKSEAEAKDANQKEERVRARLLKIWIWVKDPKHSNAVVAIFTAVIMLTGILYTTVAALQWCVMRRQLALTREQLKGSQAAFMSLNVAMDPPYGAVNVYAKNIGHVIANSFTARFIITRKKLPDLNPIGEPIVKIIQPQPVAVVGQDPLSESYSIPNFGKEEWDAMMRLEQTVFVESDVSYDDGFEDVIKIKDCKFFLYANFQARNGLVTGFNQGPWSCDSFDRMLRDATNSRRSAESEANKSK